MTTALEYKIDARKFVDEAQLKPERQTLILDKNALERLLYGQEAIKVQPRYV